MAKFFFVAGIIIMVLSGGCVLAFIQEAGWDDMYMPIALIIGGVPFVVGLIIFLIARSVLKNR